MVGVLGLRAYVVTLHQTSLLLAVGIGVAATLLFLVVAQVRRAPVKAAPAILLFAFTTLLGHVAFSWIAGYAPLQVEVIRLERTAEDPPPPRSSMVPPPRPSRA